MKVRWRPRSFFTWFLVVALAIAIIQLIGMAIGQYLGTWSEVLLPARPSRYSLTAYGIEFRYPSSWTAYETPQGNHGDKEVVAIVVAPALSETWVAIARHAGVAQDDLGSVIDWGMTRVQSRSGTQVGEIANTKTPDGHDIAILEYSWESQDLLWRKVTMKCRDTYEVRQTVGYALSMCTKDTLWDEVVSSFDDMTNSFDANGT